MDNPVKIVWITGASSGIGEALAYAYSRKGARLILSSRNEEKLEEVRERCTNPSEHIVLPLDLTESTSLEKKYDEAIGWGGHIDILFNNGGVSQRSFALETPLEIDRRIMETNFFGTVALTKTVLPGMVARKSGHVVVVSSLVGKFGTPLRSSYSASKHALHGYFDSLRSEVWREGVSVTIVCPGFIRTSISINALTCTGIPQGTMDEAQACGMASHTCALKIMDAVDKKKPEVYIGGREILGVYMKRFAPSLFNFVIRRAKVT